ncbi:hypothetical protein Salat_1355500 [Sesamum alatum]|uniref:Uncharacterized protein n=1 Tax=Sesamum alatum TaxID=300844 RepID=A0AAE2CQA1_9LAMI|nr:hypothetical protein Salat_1355500 [Sesamum alatum]
MAWSEPEFLCRKHPNQNPQPGVCPSCLRERLSRIAANSNMNIIHPASSNSPSFSSSPVSIYDHCYSSASNSSARSGSRRGHNRVGSDITSSIHHWAVSDSGLKKSRSIAFASRRDGASVIRKKKHGFWSKLLLRSNAKKL